MEKACTKCGEVKSLDAFYRAAGTRDGRRGDCIECFRRRAKERYPQIREREIARVRQWQKENPERHLANQRKLRSKPEAKRKSRAGHLKRKFGLTLDDYERMLEAQGGGCCICGTPPPEGGSLHVDHDHATGEVRGLLCFTHNNALGDFDDDPALLRSALAYLHHHDPEVQQARELTLARLMEAKAGV